MADADPGGGIFPATRWTLVRRAQGDASKKAFGELLSLYWRPLFVFARCRGLASDAAADAVQDFMVHLLERQVFVDNVDPERGRLRSYLKTSFRNFLNNDYHRQRSLKRGGGQVVVSLDVEQAEARLEPSIVDPDRAYEREWAAGVFEVALARLEREFDSEQRRGPFELVRKYFAQELHHGYGQLAADYAMSVPQLKSFLHRARQRYRQLVLSAIGDTLDSAPGVDTADHSPEAELTRLRAALS